MQMTLLLAFLIGLFAGLRSVTPPAAVAWAVYLGWLKLARPLALIGSLPAVIILSLLAVIEFILDKLPYTPSRTVPRGLIIRIGAGGFTGAFVSLGGGQSAFVGAGLGLIGGIVGCFAGYLRSARKVPAPVRFQRCFARGPGCNRWHSVHRFAILVRRQMLRCSGS